MKGQFHCFGCGKIEVNNSGMFSDGWCYDCMVRVFKYLRRHGMDELIEKALKEI